MPVIWVLICVVALALMGLAAAPRLARRSAGGDVRRLHSLPSYHALFAALLTLGPSLLLLAAWVVVQPLYADWRASAAIPAERYADAGARDLLMTEASAMARGLDVAVARGELTDEEASSRDANRDLLLSAIRDSGLVQTDDPDPVLLIAAQRLRAIEARSETILPVAVLVIAGIGLAVALRSARTEFRARNAVERAVIGLLLLASTIAILTTAGIVLSMLFESIDFFSRYPASAFFFGTNWAPNFRGDSDLGIIPLLWGTLYISLIALLVAVPIGLLAAIYMSEYATPRFRSVAKPLLEVLAGIPTIVYGLFALITVGPLLRDYFAQPLGLGNSSSSVMTAGLVMGIMLIPFVSSLSDDVINAVPQAMRDGSLGLGATQSETIRQVVLPAALPGVVGSILLAASRAIGETMIVVLGAGAAARLDVNPFEAMTTVTVKIVSQLTGDTDFNSPETLVAFALGLTLFVITLGLNVFALWIVRRYREQYE